MTRHVGLMGATGAGKTSCALNITRSILETTDSQVVVFDSKRSWRSLAAYVPEWDLRPESPKEDERADFPKTPRHRG
jgi:hypothetical protein